VKNDQTKKGQNEAKDVSSVAPGMTGKPSEEYATELGAGAAGAGATGAGTSRTSKSGAEAAKEFNEFATELGAGSATKGSASNKKQK
jgi:hypothetical protein